MAGRLFMLKRNAAICDKEVLDELCTQTTQRTPFKRWCDENTGLFFLIPWILGFLIFKAYPFASSLVYSFTDLNFFKGISQYGVMNYVEIFTSRKTVSVLLTTVKYAFITVPLSWCSRCSSPTS